MPQHHFERPRGRLVTLTIDSEALEGNLLGDPASRTVTVYLPEGYDESGEDYPLLVDAVGFTGSGYSHLNWKAYHESVPQRLDRLVASGQMGPVIAAFPDCFTSLGGNQYINSVVMGRWADFLIREMLPAIEGAFRVKPGARGIFGKSSGGYGAIVHGLRYAEHWGAVACHSGDMAFDLVYGRDMAPTLDTLAKHKGVEGFMAHLDKARKVSSRDMHALMMLAMAATYDPDPEAPFGVRLPVDLRTGAMDKVLWDRWLAHDPVQLIERPECQANLRSLEGVFIDCGIRDQYYLHYGARQLTDRLVELGIEHTYEEFEDTHSSIDYRMDVSLPFLYRALS